MRGPGRADGCAWRSGPRRRRRWRPPGSPGPVRCCSAHWPRHWRSPWPPAHWRPAAPSARCPARRPPSGRAPGRSPGAPFSATPAQSVLWPPPREIQSWSSPFGLPVVLDVSLEGASGREFTKLVTDHRLGDEHRDVLASVVDGKRVADEVRNDRRTTRPCLDHLFGVLLVLYVHLLEQVAVDERALLQAAWHVLITPGPGFPQRPCFLPVRRRRTMSLLLALLGWRVRPSGLP